MHTTPMRTPVASSSTHIHGGHDGVGGVGGSHGGVYSIAQHCAAQAVASIVNKTNGMLTVHVDRVC